MREVIRGLSYVHRAGYIHRDLKPENVLLSGLEGRAKLCDFGQTKAVAFNGDFTPYVSTRWYRAPELLLKARRYSTAADMWAAGTMMAEMYSLRPIFAGESESDMLFKIASVLGAPRQWPQGMRLAQRAGLSFPSMEALGLASLVPTATPDALEFMQALLHFDPALRPTADQALQMPYLQVSACFVNCVVATVSRWPGLGLGLGMWSGLVACQSPLCESIQTVTSCCLFGVAHTCTSRHVTSRHVTTRHDTTRLDTTEP